LSTEAHPGGFARLRAFLASATSPEELRVALGDPEAGVAQGFAKIEASAAGVIWRIVWATAQFTAVMVNSRMYTGIALSGTPRATWRLVLRT
jgi:hypothetical protein